MRIRNIQVTPLEFDFWALIASGVIAGVLAAMIGWNRVGLFFVVCSVSGFVNAWRLSARMERERELADDAHSSATTK